MKRTIGRLTCLLLSGWISCCALLGNPGRLAAQPSTEPPEGVLHLKNGDHVLGRLEPAEDPQTLRWTSPLFSEPIEFDIHGVSHIEYGAASTGQPQDAVTAPDNSLTRDLVRWFNQLPPETSPPPSAIGSRIELVGGHMVVGTIERIDEQHVHIDSARHGGLSVERSRVYEIVTPSPDRPVLLDGTTHLNSWNVLQPHNHSTGDWTQVDGELVTNQSGANLFFEPTTGKRFAYELELAGRDTPQFQLVFGMGSSPHHVPRAFSIEAWVGELVVHRQLGKEFVRRRLRPFHPQDGEWTLKLDVYFDGEANRLVVTSGGRQLGELITPGQPPRGRGFMIRNRGTQLRVRRARVREWIGPDAPTYSEDQDIAMLSDGSWMTGRVASYGRGDNRLSIRTPGGLKSVDATLVDHLRLAGAHADEAAARPLVQIAYSDGGMISGRYVRTDESGVWLETDFSAEPVRAGWAGLHAIRLNYGPPPEPSADAIGRHGKIEYARTALHGYTLNSDRPAPLCWQPIYSRRPVTFRYAAGARVHFELRPTKLPDETSSELVLINGDTLPCRVETIDEESVTVSLVTGEVVRVARDSVKHVRDSHAENRILIGFKAGDRWHAVRNDASEFRLRGGVLELMGHARLARKVPLPDRVRISMVVQLSPGANLVVGVGGDTLENALMNELAGGMHFPAAMQRAMQAPPDTLIEMVATRNEDIVSVRGGSRRAGFPEHVMFQHPQLHDVQDASVQVRDNPMLRLDWLIDRQERRCAILGNGKLMYRWSEMAPWEGDVFHIGAQTWASTSPNPRQPSVSIYDLRIERWPSEMDVDHRDRLLTRPRGTKDTSITHVLRAVNGDALRGRLLAVLDDEIIFQSRLKTLHLPRTAVAEIIKLEPSEREVSESEPDGDSEAPVTRVLFADGSGLRLENLCATESVVSGTSPLAGALSVPWSSVSGIQFGADAFFPPYATDEWVLRDPPALPPAEAPSEIDTSAWLNRPVPDMTLTMLDGRKRSLAELRGRPVVLEFWATWCGPCIASLPAMMELAEEFQGKVELVAINQQEDPDDVRGFVESRLWRLDVALDVDGSVNRMFGVGAIPYTMVLDRDGVVRHIQVGASPDLKTRLRQVLNALIAP